MHNDPISFPLEIIPLHILIMTEKVSKWNILYPDYISYHSQI